jgi:hypothetical protein
LEDALNTGGIGDMLADVFGYDKYFEVTSEYAIRGTYCDLAIKLDGKLTTLIEVKAVGIDLKEQHIKQAVDYAANQGVDWSCSPLDCVGASITFTSRSRSSMNW